MGTHHLEADPQAAYEYLLQHFPPNRIILFGRSIGTGPTVELGTWDGQGWMGWDVGGGVEEMAISQNMLQKSPIAGLWYWVADFYWG